MANESFIAYATSSAFRLDLSKSMIQALIALDANAECFWLSSFATIRGLRQRGLIKHHAEHPCWRLTNAGELVVELLMEAGFESRDMHKALAAKGE